MVDKSMASWAQLMLLTLLPGSTRGVDTVALPRMVYPATVACEEFARNASLASWSVSDCERVWGSWAHSVTVKQERVSMDRKVLQHARELFGRDGLRCFVEMPRVKDGVGSSAIRSIVTWIFAKEVGCSWVVPNWGRRQIEDDEGGGHTRYCHPVKPKERRDMGPDNSSRLRPPPSNECVLVNWIKYFSFDQHSVPLPEHGIVKTIVLDPGASRFNNTLEDLRNEVGVVDRRGGDHLVWDFLLFRFSDPNSSSRIFQAFSNWDAHKRRITRDAIKKLKETFYEREEQRTFNATKECQYGEARLNFVIHVRLGDRKNLFTKEDNYFKLLGVFMETVTSRVVDMGLARPLFHVFSETASPCPDPGTGRFMEFSKWAPVERWQIEPCWDAKAPETCPQKEAGLVSSCPPERSGTFRLEGMPVILHLDPNAVKATSCMIHGDGILMGCSTFGHIAGILTKGISFFSMQCHGLQTRDQYRLVPPIAISELGRLWVPVSGSWRNPQLWSEDALTEALDEYVTVIRNSSSS